MSLLVGAASNGPSGYFLEDSLRFRSSASAYLNRTPSSAGNRKTFTISMWVKRGKLGTEQKLATAYNANNNNGYFELKFSSSDQIYFGVYTTGSTSAAVFRDPSAWYHVVLKIDTTQASSANRVKVYINNTDHTVDVGGTLAQDTDLAWNNTVVHSIGRDTRDSNNYMDGYLTEINNVDGQALLPTSFGETDNNGTWIPKKYTGTYGTNGFYLNFSNSSSVAALGTDSSGNSNTWTVNNVSLTAGVTYDLMSDVPTLTDEDTSNFATLNPLVPSGSVTIDQANLKATSGTNAQRSNVSTISVSSGKYYWETTWNTVGANDAAMTGIIGVDNLNPDSNFGGTNSYAYLQDGGKQGAGSYTGSYGDRYVAGDIIGTALDLDAGTITFYRNGTTQGTAFTSLPSVEYYLGCSFYNSGDNFDINFGQRPFAYTPPTGFKKLNTFNLPDSTILDGSKYFDTALYTGSGAAQSITGTEFSPDFVWVKNRSHNGGDPYYGVHLLFDSIRGVGNRVMSSSTAAEAFSAQSLTSFTSDGFNVGTDNSISYSGDAFVGWQWRGSDSTAASIAAGSIDGTNPTIASTVSANTTAGFSVVTYTGNATAGATVGHGLGVAPAMVIVKSRSATESWEIAHQSLAATQTIRLNSTASALTSADFNNTRPSATVFTLGSFTGTNQNSGTYVAYCFAEVEGYSKISSYVGNGSADGPFIYTGFRPSFVLRKNVSTTNEWILIDSTRSPFNQTNETLVPNANDAEDGDFDIDILSNGFKVRTSESAHNGSGNTIIYMAFAENPFKNSIAR